MQKNHYLSLAALLPAVCAQAIEVTPGDYEQLPAGTTLGLVYYQHSTTDALYAGGDKSSSDFRLTSDVGILRLIHVIGLSDSVTVDPQVLLPFGQVDGSGDASALGDASGTADLILAAPIRLRLNQARDVIALTPYLYVPTGRYDNENTLNLGENRWKLDLQAAYVKHFSEKWALDLVGDAIWYGDNDDVGAASVRREQDVSYAAQVMGRYMPTAGTSFAIGFGHSWGGENEVAGIRQDDAMQTTNFRVTAATFVTPKDQLQVQLGRDLAVENGSREDFRVNLRYLHIF
ncbi:Putative MetA-pathway of phenol degradation [Pseudomonas flavescens]|uniref:Putative MetA-pathway of phenol degradation n=1 Tax=Phytopseudomonas flavescens TaxID=29435 RepID=A0A1G8MER1_9GAMM|nr:transporter [Pseudomonas flavescens]SDI65830.1 Putative MetA-pathway of phenol degradation [Pseudomonas flavescens]